MFATLLALTNLPPVWVQVLGMVLVATPPTLMALASLRTSKATRADVATNHGKTPGQHIEDTSVTLHDVKHTLNNMSLAMDTTNRNVLQVRDDVAEVRMIINDHVRDRILHRLADG